MTLHINKPDFKCSKCKTVFIPYKIGIKCPKCNNEVKEDISEYLNFIKNLVGSMRVHKMQYGRYHPGAWYVGSMSDHIQSLIFQIFDSMEYDSEKNKEKEYLSKSIDEIKWKDEKGNQEYLKGYVKEIAFEVLDIYIKENFASIKKEMPSLITRIKKWFGEFMP